MKHLLPATGTLLAAAIVFVSGCFTNLTAETAIPGAEDPGAAQDAGAEVPGAEASAADVPDAEVPGAEATDAEASDAPDADAPGAEASGAEDNEVIPQGSDSGSTVAGAICVGCDVDCNAIVDIRDVDAFLGALDGRCSDCSADLNCDGSVNYFDIQPFVNCVFDNVVEPCN